MSKHIALTLGIVAALATAAPAGQMEIVEQVLVKVNGDIVTKSEFEQRTVDALRTRPELVNAPINSPLIAQAVAEVTPGLILDAVDELLLVQRGREMGYAMGDAQFQDLLATIRQQNGLEDEAEFELALQQEGITLAELRRQLERGMLVQRVQQDDVMGRLVITDEETRAYYDANRSQFTTPVTVTLRELLIEVPVTELGINAGEANAAQAEIDTVRERAVAGESFVALVEEFSDAPSAANGGLIGPLSYEDLTPALQAQIDGLMVGGVTQVLRTQRGFQILRLESRTQPRVVTYQEALTAVSNAVANEKIGAEMQTYLERLRNQATIEFQNEELEAAYETALAAQRAQFGGAPVAAAPTAGDL